MTRPVVTYPDPEVTVRVWLAAALAPYEPTAVVSVGVPQGWTPASPPHIQVALDGTPIHDHPIAIHSTIRLVARTGSTSESKRLAMLTQALLCAHPGGTDIRSTRFLTGVLTARDHTAELASTTTRVTLRAIPVPAPT